MFGPLEIVLILVVVLLLFGAKKLPELGKGLGQGIRGFKEETRDLNKPDADAPYLNSELANAEHQTGGEVVDVVATELRSDSSAVNSSVATTHEAVGRERQG